jgi:perosamine synthetase
MRRLPVAAPDLGGNEERYVVDAIRSSWISSTGPYVDRFEREFAAWTGSRAAIGVSNGTVALHLALLAYGAGPGDEVIVPSLTYVATANAVRYVGATPVFVDVHEDTWCLDPERVAEAITDRTRGIITVDLYGHPSDMDGLQAVAASHGIWIVEDAAEAHGATYKGRRVGSLTGISTFSFYGNKILTSGEGGAVTVDDPELERRMRLFRGQGMDPQRRYYFIEIGYNYRLTNVSSAILCAQLERADALIAARDLRFSWYQRALDGVPGIGFQPVAPWARRAPWLFCITVDPVAFGLTRDELAAALDRAGIETRPFFVPIHELPPYAAFRPSFPLPVTERLARTGMNLPTGSSISEADVTRVTAIIRGAGAKR